jgi:hypothetical protein
MINSGSLRRIDQHSDWRKRYFWDGATPSTPGITSGPLASRPLACAVGQGYWATNQSTADLTGMVGAHPTTPIFGTLYKCTALNSWTAFYTPYSYPHPLRGEGVIQPPAPPATYVAGDFNKDGFVNSLDFSYMNSKWNTSDTTADLSKDGTVNTLDFSIMSRNWTG